jgi:D-psicose/D-tagatose/L-ribulose 3-epimerase
VGCLQQAIGKLPAKKTEAEMKFGVNTFIWSATFDPSHFGLLPKIKGAGFDGVEVPLLRPGEFRASEIRKATEAHGLECNACTVLVDGLSLISESADVRRRTRLHLEDIAKAAAEAGAKIVAGPLYSPVGYLPGRRRISDEWKWAVEGFQSLGDTLAANGVTFAIEPLNRFETYFLNTAADAASLAEQIGHPNIGILFDTFHANIEEKKIAAGYRAVGPHLKHVHTCENDRGTPGSGHVEWREVFQALRDLKYDGWLTIEGFASALKDLSAAASIWRDIEPTAESIAFDGVGFLRKSVTESTG